MSVGCTCPMRFDYSNMDAVSDVKYSDSDTDKSEHL
jgi:hypothetical protein